MEFDIKFDNEDASMHIEMKPGEELIIRANSDGTLSFINDAEQTSEKNQWDDYEHPGFTFYRGLGKIVLHEQSDDSQNGEYKTLAPKEEHMLEVLCESENKILTPEVLQSILFPETDTILSQSQISNAAKVYILRLRKKLGDSRKYLYTVKNHGPILLNPNAEDINEKSLEIIQSFLES